MKKSELKKIIKEEIKEFNSPKSTLISMLNRGEENERKIKMIIKKYLLSYLDLDKMRTLKQDSIQYDRRNWVDDYYNKNQESDVNWMPAFLDFQKAADTSSEEYIDLFDEVFYNNILTKI